MEFPPDGYRRNVGISRLNSSGKTFAASWRNRLEIWEMPQGGRNEGEDLKTAAKRVLTEEVGVTSADIIAELPCWLDRSKACEQTNKFLLKFTGNDKETNLLGDGTERQEFEKWYRCQLNRY